MAVSKEELLKEIRHELGRSDLSRRQRATLEQAYENALRGREGLVPSIAGLIPPLCLPGKVFEEDTI